MEARELNEIKDVDDNSDGKEKRKIKRRGLTTRNVYERKPGKAVVSDDAVISGVLGEDAECGGLWLISGKEKNGKTSFALMLARSLAGNHRVVYISAEEGTEGSFRAAMRRAGITVSDRIIWEEYMSPERIIEDYKGARTADFIFIDNLTVYRSEIGQTDILSIRKALPGKTIVYVSHEEGNQPSPESAVMVAKLAKIVFRVVAMNVIVTSRYTNGGGNIVIDADRKSLFWGEK